MRIEQNVHEPFPGVSIERPCTAPAGKIKTVLHTLPAMAVYVLLDEDLPVQATTNKRGT